MDYANSNKIIEEGQNAVIYSQRAKPEESAACKMLPETDFPELAVDFEDLKDVNPEIIGWIMISGSKINYPILQGPDNKKYLHLAFNNQYSVAGSIFVDYRNSRDFADANTLVYGHNMKNGSMFAELRNLANQDYYNEHSEFYIYTPEMVLKYWIVAAYKTKNGSESYRMNFDGEGSPAKYLQAACNKSLIESGYTPREEKSMVLLSTCTGISNERFVVHGVLTDVKMLNG